jgi:transcriptional regulator with XRE-family HTH domain
MGLVAADVQIDHNLASGAYGYSITSTAIHLHLSEEEFAEKYRLYRGTGGSFALVTDMPITGTKVHIEDQAEGNLATAVNQICSSFGLTKDELAKACHIQTRKTLYNWINGDASPRKSALRRIFDLHSAANTWKNNGFPSCKEDLYSPQANGKSLFDALCEANIDLELILFMGSRINTMSSPPRKISDPFA